MASKQDGEITIRLPLGECGDTFDERVDPTTKLSRSRNVRMKNGLATKAPGVVTVGGHVTSRPTCHGLAAVPDQDAGILYMRPRDGQQTIKIGVNGAAVRSTTLDAYEQNAYFPVQVKACETSQLGGTLGVPTVCVDDASQVWTAAVKDVNGAYSVYVSVDLSNGTRLASSKLVASPPGAGVNYPWIALTNHPSVGVRLWVMDRVGFQITMYELTLSNTLITVASSAAIFVPLACTPAICGDNDTYAFLITRSAAVAADVVIHQIDVATGARVGLNLAGVASASTVYLAITQAGMPSAYGGTAFPYVGYAISDTATNTQMGVVRGDTMAALWGTGGLYGFGRVAVGIRATAFGTDDRHLVLATEPANGSVGSATPQRVVFDARRLATGTGTTTKTEYWWQIARSGTSYNSYPVASSTFPEIYPFFGLVRNTTGSAFDALDPALQIVTAHRFADGTWGIASIARLGVDEEHAAVAYGTYGSPVAWSGDTMAITYSHSLPGNTNNELVPIYVALDLRSQSIPVAHHDGCGYIAAAQPAYFDGTETVELGHLNRPDLTSDNVGVGALSGDYSYKAVFRYTDARGNVRRSAPSRSITVTGIVTRQIDIYVTVPASFVRNGIRQDTMSVELYSTRYSGGAASSDYYFLWALPASSAANGAVQFASVNNPAGTTMLLYSLEGAIDELVPEAPPALWDACSVGDRVWTIEAENRSAAGYSKAKSDSFVGFATEFNRIQRVMFPAGAGKLMAVRDGGGYPLFFASDGLYAISGDGPESNLSGTLFSQPRQVSKFGCLMRESVLTTPFGTFFCTSDGKAAVVAGGQVKVFDEIDLSYCLGSFALLDEAEAVFALGTLDYGGADTFVAYNWRYDTWNTWDICPDRMAAFGVMPFTNSCIGYTRASVVPYSIAWDIRTSAFAPTSSIATYAAYSGQMSMRTAWITPAGENGDMAFREVTLRAMYGAAHSLTIRVEYDYDSTDYIDRSWTYTELTALKQTDGLYTVCVQLTKHSCRAIRVTLTESAALGNALRPVSLTASYGASPGNQRRALKPGALK